MIGHEDHVKNYFKWTEGTMMILMVMVRTVMMIFLNISFRSTEGMLGYIFVRYKL